MNVSSATDAVAALLALPILPLVLLARPVPAQEAQDEAADTTSRRGFYTEEQAERGEEAFSNSCGYCHSESEFSGSSFIQSWSGAPLGQLYGVISSTMPRNAPGSLPPQTYTDIIAYILSLNDFPAGEEVLPADPDALHGILMEKPSGDAEEEP